MKKALGNIIKKNVFLADKIYNIYSYREEATLKKNIEYLTNIDSLESIDEIAAFQKKCAAGESIYTSKNRNMANSRIYGISASIFKGIDDKELFFPAVEHGLIFYDFVDTHVEETVRPTVVTFGEFRKQIIRAKLDLPVFCVGPYIHYAPDYYDPKKMTEKKRILGKNLLVFPQHSTDMAVLSEDDKRFIERIEKEARQFDSVTVSAFWWNLNDALIQRLKANGYIVICNGFREDPKFLSRQKASIELCDRAIGDGMGTHIGYCIHLGKPYTYFDSGIIMQSTNTHEIEHSDYMRNIVNKIKSEFEGNEITTKQREICAKYWGEGEEKSDEEIHTIYKINKEITNNSKGQKVRFKEETEKYLRKLEKGTIEYRLLEGAIK